MINRSIYGRQATNHRDKEKGHAVLFKRSKNQTKETRETVETKKKVNISSLYLPHGANFIKIPDNIFYETSHPNCNQTGLSLRNLIGECSRSSKSVYSNRPCSSILDVYAICGSTQQQGHVLSHIQSGYYVFS